MCFRNFFEKVIAILLACQCLTLVQGFAIVLDQAVDQDPFMWHVEGKVEYFQDGNAVSGALNYFLPDGFTYANIALSKGIWAIVPTLGKHCKELSNSIEGNQGCGGSAAATFKFKLSALLAESANVRYCFGGANATIRILKGDGGLIKEIRSSNKTLDYWNELSVHLDQSSMQVEGIVGGEGDYILIDSITVNTFEITTTTTSTTLAPTSQKPQPGPDPKGGQRGMLDLAPAVLLIFLVLIPIHLQN